MIDNSTGLIHELHPQFDEIRHHLIPEIQSAEAALDEALQKAKDYAQPNRSFQGATFTKGEVIEIRGSKFKVNGFSQKRLYLDALPS